MAKAKERSKPAAAPVGDRIDITQELYEAISPGQSSLKVVSAYGKLAGHIKQLELEKKPQRAQIKNARVVLAFLKNKLIEASAGEKNAAVLQTRAQRFLGNRFSTLGRSVFGHEVVYAVETHRAEFAPMLADALAKLTPDADKADAVKLHADTIASLRNYASTHVRPLPPPTANEPKAPAAEQKKEPAPAAEKSVEKSGTEIHAEETTEDKDKAAAAEKTQKEITTAKAESGKGSLVEETKTKGKKEKAPRKPIGASVKNILGKVPLLNRLPSLSGKADLHQVKFKSAAIIDPLSTTKGIVCDPEKLAFWAHKMQPDFLDRTVLGYQKLTTRMGTSYDRFGNWVASFMPKSTPAAAKAAATDSKDAPAETPAADAPKTEATAATPAVAATPATEPEMDLSGIEDGAFPTEAIEQTQPSPANPGDGQTQAPNASDASGTAEVKAVQEKKEEKPKDQIPPVVAKVEDPSAPIRLEDIEADTSKAAGTPSEQALTIIRTGMTGGATSANAKALLSAFVVAHSVQIDNSANNGQAQTKLIEALNKQVRELLAKTLQQNADSSVISAAVRNFKVEGLPVTKGTPKAAEALAQIRSDMAGKFAQPVGERLKAIVAEINKAAKGTTQENIPVEAGALFEGMPAEFNS